MVRAHEALSAELARLKGADAPQADSVITDLSTRLAQLRTRAAAGMGSMPGNLFDLLPAIEASSLPPTDAQQRLLATIVDNSVAVVTELNEIITVRMPALRASLGQTGPAGVSPVRPPR